MQLSRIAGPILFAAGGLALAIGFAQGDASLSLVVIVPVITATGLWSALGILLLVAGFFVTIMTWPFRVEPPFALGPTGTEAVRPPPPASAKGRRWGGILFLGPIPIVFGSDTSVTRTMLILGLILFLALLALTLFIVLGAL